MTKTQLERFIGIENWMPTATNMINMYIIIFHRPSGNIQAKGRADVGIGNTQNGMIIKREHIDYNEVKVGIRTMRLDEGVRCVYLLCVGVNDSRLIHPRI